MSDWPKNPLLENFFTQAADAIEITDHNALITHVNPAFEEATGYNSADVIGKLSTELFPLDTRISAPIRYEDIYAKLSAYDVWNGEIHARKKDGSVWISEATIVAVRDQKGQIQQYITTKHNVTAQKTTEDEQRRDQLRLEVFEKVGSDWFWELDADLRFSYISPSLFEKTGMDPQRLIGKTALENNPDRIHSAAWRKHLDDLAQHRPFKDFSFSIYPTDDSEVFLSVSADPIFDNAGNFTGYIGVATDITKAKSTETDLSRRNHQFKSAITHISQGISLFDEDQTLVMSNDNYATLYGLKPAQIKPGMKLDEILQFRFDNGFYIGENPGDYHHTLNQKIIPYNDIATVHQLNDGRFIELRLHKMPEGGWVSTHEDVTKRIQAAEELTNQIERFDAALSNMSQGLCLFDGDRNLIVSNDRYAETYKLPTEKLKPGVNINEIVKLRAELGTFSGDDPRNKENTNLQSVNSNWVGDNVKYLNDGRYIEVHKQDMPDGGWLSTHEDVTERVLIDGKITTQNLWFNAALSNISQGLCLFDSDKRLLVSNDLYATIYSLSPDKIKPGMHIKEIVQLRIKHGNYIGKHADEAMGRIDEWHRKYTESVEVVQLNDGRYIELLFRPMDGGGWLSTLEDVTERVQAKNDLEERNQRMDAALETMAQGLCMFDGNRDVIVANDQYAAIYGFKPEELEPGTNLLELLKIRAQNGHYAGESPEAYLKDMDVWIEEHEDSVKVVQLANGPYIEIRFRPMAGGGWLSIHEDITERLEAEELIKVQNSQLDAAIANMSQGFCMFDVYDNLIMANDQYAHIYDLPVEALQPGISVDEICDLRLEKSSYYGDNLADFRTQMSTWLDGPVIRELHNGRFVEVRDQELPDGSWIETHEDVSEKKRAEQTLLDSQEMLVTAFKVNPIPVVIANVEDGRHLDVNEAWARTLGHSYDEAVGKTALELGLWANLEDRVRFYERMQADGYVHEFAAPLKTKDGRVIDCLLSVQFLDIAGQNRLIIITQDITERRAAELELLSHRDHLQELIEAATKELKAKADELAASLATEKEMSAMQRQFVSMASHEFRTPLAIIDGTAQRMKKRITRNQATTEDSVERLDKIRAAVVRMTKLMESTLSAAQMEEGKFSVNIQPCRISKIIASVCERQQGIAVNHDISHEIVDLPETIMADPGCVEQILTNLLSNAVKYSPNDRRIDVLARVEGENLLISVSDDGLGIDADDLPRMFERFFRAKTSIGIAGTGIGLNLANVLIGMHDGSLDVESKLNEGSTFTVSLPLSGPKNKDKTTQAA